MAGKLTGRTPVSSSKLVARILEEPALVEAVQGLPAWALGKLINHVGLEDSGDIVALATTEQLRRVFDDDLWHSEQPGKDATFDPERFSTWLEIMLEVGEQFAAQKLAELPEDLVTLALERLVLVIDIDALAVQMADNQTDESEQLEKALESCLCEEIGQYRIIARHPDGWDAILSVLLALDRDHHEALERLLERCCAIASQWVEESGGLYEVLTAGETLAADVAADRDDRRAAEGFIAPSSAASFLAWARTTPLDEQTRLRTRDPIAKAYFRELRPEIKGRQDSGTTAAHGRADAASGTVTSASATAHDLVEILRQAEVLEPARLPLLLAASDPATESAFTSAMRALKQSAAAEHDMRLREMAFLANVLVEGASLEGHAFRPVEAASATLACCNLGLEWVIAHRAAPAGRELGTFGAEKLFAIAWRLLCQDVATPAARALASAASSARAKAESDLRPALDRAIAALKGALANGKPWLAKSKLAVLQDVLDQDFLASLLALIEPYPTMRGALARRATGASPVPAEPEAARCFFSTLAQLETVRAFLSAAHGAPTAFVSDSH